MTGPLDYFTAATGDGVEDQGGESGGRVLYRAVVVEIVTLDSSAELTANWGDVLSDISSKKLPYAPRNSIIAQLFAGNLKNKKPVLCYPFFPPYLCFPIKPGEQVWVIGEVAGTPGTEPYWLCRIPEDRRVDDLNYTHADRKWQNKVRDATAAGKLFDDPANPQTGIELPSFPNGTGNIRNRTLNQKVRQPNPFDIIVDGSPSMANFTREPIPRWAKRPGDTVLQGSNNTIVSLGEDRGWKFWQNTEKAVASNVYRTNDPAAPHMLQKGTIDLVAGRGRWGVNPTTDEAFGMPPINTAPRTIYNTRKWIETDKYPEANALDFPGAKNNNPPGEVPPAIEGDPDFISDSSRVYISMKTMGDMNFGITQTTFTPVEEMGDMNQKVDFDVEGEGPYMATSMNPDNPIRDQGPAPFVIAKSDHVRLIARRVYPAVPRELAHGVHPESTVDIAGSVRIVKEGLRDDDLAVILLRPDGSIQISGKKIYIGRSEEDGGFADIAGLKAGTNKGPGDDDLDDPGTSQPWVKYHQLEELWNALMDELTTFCDNMTGAPTPGYGNPSPKIDAAVATLKTKIGLPEASNGLKGSIVRLKSKRIFGE
ncbi:hypothetical protein CL634_08155 [bacterium]|nr:hypothetical protein [bacterium]